MLTCTDSQDQCYCMINMVSEIGQFVYFCSTADSAMQQTTVVSNS